MLIEVCDKFRFFVLSVVVVIVVVYLKWFYLRVLVMDYFFREMFLVCLYMVCKVEEYNILVDCFVEIFLVDRREKIKDFIFVYELLLM